MKITAWDINRFGIWKGLSASDLSPEINVFYGPNEAGKTTLMQFVRAMLYGFAGERQRYVAGPFPKWEKTEQEAGRPAGEKPAGENEKVLPLIAGGTMSIRLHTGSFQLRRQYDPNQRDKEEKFTVSTQDGIFNGDQFTKHFTSVIDEATFNNVFAIGLDELQQLGILSDTEAAEVLYRLTMGLDRVSLLEITKKLIKSRNAWIDPSGKPAQMEHLYAQKLQLQGEITKTKTQIRVFNEILTEHRQIDRITTQIETELGKLRYESRLYETATLLTEIWDTRAAVLREIRLMGKVAPVGVEVLQSLDDLKAKIAASKLKIEGLKKQCRETKKKHDLLEVNESLWKFTPRLEVVLEQEQWITDLEEQIKAVKLEVESFKKQLTDQENAFSVSTENASATSSQQLGDFRVPAQAIKVARQRYKRIKLEHQQFMEKAKILSDKISGELSNRKIEDIADAVEKNTELVGHLRRRQTIQQRFDEMILYRKELDRQNAFLVQNQTLPPWGIFVIGSVAVAGATTALLAILSKIPQAYILLGIFGIAGPIFTKITIEKKNARKLETNQRQISMLHSQMEHAKQEAAAIDARYPAQGKSTEMRFQAAQMELAALEKLIPLDRQRKDIQNNAAIINDRLKKSKHSLSFAMKRWTDWLEAAGLPKETQPGQIRDLMEQFDAVGGIRKECDLKVEELEMRKRELEMLTGQLTRIATAAGIELPTHFTPTKLMDHIRTIISENESHRTQQHLLKKELRHLKRLRKTEQETTESLQLQRTEIFTQHGVKHTEEIREMVEMFQRYSAYTEKRDSQQREIDAAIRGFCQEEAIASTLELGKRENLPALLEQINERTELLSLELHEELEKKGQLTQQLHDLGHDRSFTEKQLELAMLNEQIQANIRQWKKETFASHVLDGIRHEYELKRQPETLNEASGYFAKMTEGRYTRIWTPIGENTLYVDDFVGNSMDVSWLSRGTREQLFVAIRLALATSFERDGTSLPLVMDDVLVNYDTKRAYSTAKMLLDFSAQGRQIFLFTCHEHICKMFHTLGIPVHVLPSFSDEPKIIRVVSPIRKEKVKEEIAEPVQETTEEIFPEMEPELEPEMETKTINKIVEEEILEKIPRTVKKTKLRKKKKRKPNKEKTQELGPVPLVEQEWVEEEILEEPELEPEGDFLEIHLPMPMELNEQRGVFDVDFFDGREEDEILEIPSVLNPKGADTRPKRTVDKKENFHEAEPDDFFVKGFFDEDGDEEELDSNW